jgi:hypothetical protein
MGKRSVVALTPWRAATSSISRSWKGLPTGLPPMVRMAGDEREGMNGDGRWGNANEPKGSIGAQGLEVGAPVLIGVDGGEDEVE